ncbi:BTBD3_6 [Lepeophtheirus salmonis]|uniref:BTBD3_6 n=1 Tax=Lepeophtheirus salmonis TaxID=72036 RepID=A0A7R8H8M4_LEPSM|nr:BTBD3_6 [Lepeophtheirus salmonis]CAF2942437.1 BTBD3_6 [Lepeophtheirus salmonis]
MFNSAFMESNDPEMKIEVPDVEPDTFEDLLAYIYLDRITFNKRNVLPLLYCSKNIVETSNAIYLISRIRVYDTPKLLDKCWDVISKDPKSAFESDHIAEIDFPTLNEVLSKKELKYSEIDAFIAALKWATAQLGVDDNAEDDEESKVRGSKKREVLGEAFYKICFDQMSIEDVSEHVVPSGVLSSDETVEIFVNISSLQKNQIKGKYLPWISHDYVLYDENVTLCPADYRYSSSIKINVTEVVILGYITIFSSFDVVIITISKDGRNIFNVRGRNNRRNYLQKIRHQNVYVEFLLKPESEYTLSVSTNCFRHSIANKTPSSSSTFKIEPNFRHNCITAIQYFVFENKK